MDIENKISNLRINGSRLWDSLMEMAKIGPGVAGGNNRQTLTDEDAEGRFGVARRIAGRCRASRGDDDTAPRVTRPRDLLDRVRGGSQGAAEKAAAQQQDHR